MPDRLSKQRDPLRLRLCPGHGPGIPITDHALAAASADRPRAVRPKASPGPRRPRKTAVIIGPALGGVIYLLDASAVYGASAPYFSQWQKRIHGRHPHDPPRPVPHEPVTLNSLFGGIVYIRGHPVILGAITLDLFATSSAGRRRCSPLRAGHTRCRTVGLGLLRSAPAVGAVLVSACLVARRLRSESGRIMLVSVAMFGLATIVFGLSRSLSLSLAALVVMGAADMVSVVIRLAGPARDAPTNMRGRVSAVNSLCTGTFNHLGQFRVGFTAAWFGTVPSVVIGGLGTLLWLSLWLRWFPGLARRQSLQT